MPLSKPTNQALEHEMTAAGRVFKSAPNPSSCRDEVHSDFQAPFMRLRPPLSGRSFGRRQLRGPTANITATALLTTTRPAMAPHLTMVHTAPTPAGSCCRGTCPSPTSCL